VYPKTASWAATVTPKDASEWASSVEDATGGEVPQPTRLSSPTQLSTDLRILYILAAK